MNILNLWNVIGVKFSRSTVVSRTMSVVVKVILHNFIQTEKLCKGRSTKYNIWTFSA